MAADPDRLLPVPAATPAASSTPITTPNERSWAMGAHLATLSGFFIPLGSLIGPLIVWLVKKDQMPFVDQQAKEALNFQISMYIYAIVAGGISIVATIVTFGILFFVPIIVIGGLMIADIVLSIIAAVKAGEGYPYAYPLTLRLIR